MSKSKLKFKMPSYKPVFTDLEPQNSKGVEFVFGVIKDWGLDVHTWFAEYKKACDENGGRPPADIEKFLPWNMSPEELQRLKKPTPVDFTDMTCMAKIWSDAQ